MQDLVASRKQSMIRAGLIASGRRQQRRRHRSADLGFNDAAEDLKEIASLLADLGDYSVTTELPSPNFFDARLLCLGRFESQFKDGVSTLRERFNEISDSLYKSANRGDETDSELLSKVRKECLALKSQLSMLYKQRGHLLCTSDWQSPVYSASVPFGGNRLTDGIAEHAFDYKRDGHLDSLAYENAFVAEYYAQLGSSKLKSYLLNNGVAAWTNVLHWLSRDTEFGDAVFALDNVAPEKQNLITSFFPEAIVGQCAPDKDIVSALKRIRPSVICLDGVPANSVFEEDVFVSELDAVLDYVRGDSAGKVAVVVDVTGLPGAVLPKGMLAQMPDRVSILFIERLEQHHHFGLDSAKAGIVVAHISEELHENFKASRARYGTNISDSSVGILPSPDRARLGLRLSRHARNTRLLADVLDSAFEDVDSVLDSCHWRGFKRCPWYAGVGLVLRFRPKFRSSEFVATFADKVRALAFKAGFALGKTKILGADITSLFVDRVKNSDECVIVIAPGTETAQEVCKLAKLIKSVSVEASLVGSVLSDTVTEARAQMVGANVYSGPNALQEYLCPENYPATPLVELPPDLNPFRSDGVKIFAKMVPLVPLMNIKSIPAYSMLQCAFERGDLDGVKNIIESSSSNTVLSLSIISKLFGIDNTCAIVDHSIAPGLLRMLRLFGIEIFMHPAAGHEYFGKLEPRSERAANTGKLPGWFNPGQYTNNDNPGGFAKWLAPQIWQQTAGEIALLSCALGTCGTMVGVSRGLRNFNPNIEVLACCPEKGALVPGPRDRSLLGDVTFPWQSVANHSAELTAEESFSASIKLIRRGIMGGPSSGMNYAGLLKQLALEKETGRLAERLRESGELTMVFLCCDSPLPHIDEYYDALSESYFPEVHPVPAPSTTSI
ncbi:MAG TPA: pyridoxal-phosphate dependent enzyme [Oculatellaceae cyanobacterium]